MLFFELFYPTFFFTFSVASRCKTNACSCIKLQMACNEFCGCVERGCDNRYNKNVENDDNDEDDDYSDEEDKISSDDDDDI